MRSAVILEAAIFGFVRDTSRGAGEQSLLLHPGIVKITGTTRYDMC